MKAKRLISLILCLSMVFACVQPVLANNVILSSTPINDAVEQMSSESRAVAEDFEWNMSSDGTLTISGNGDMPETWSAPWMEYANEIKKVVISEGITSVADSAFVSYDGKYSGYAIEEVLLPDSLTRIGYNAFSGCENLKSITIPQNVSEIGDTAFLNCTSLTDVVVLGTLETIGGSTFNGCTSLKNVTLSESVKYIGSRAFYLCEALEKVIFKGSEIYIDYEAFEHSTLLKTAGGLNSGCDVEYGWKDNVYSTGLSAFSQVTTLKIPEGVETIGDSAFAYNLELSDVSLPDTLKVLGPRSFSSCVKLEEITLPEGVTTIGDEAFAMYYEGKIEGDGESFGLKAIDIPDSVTEIGNSVFYGCKNLKNITIPQNVSWMGDTVFCDCTSLTDVVVLGTLDTIGGSVFNGCTSLKTVTLSENVKNIGSRAFYLCEALEKVIFKSGEAYIDYEAFEHSTLLKTAGGLNSGCDVEYGWKDNVYSTGLSAFSQVTTLKIPEGVETIGDSAFAYNLELSDVSLPDTLKVLGPRSFSSCVKLEEITLPEGVTTIGDEAFAIYDRVIGEAVSPGLKSIYIPQSVTEIGYNVFFGCDDVVILCEPGSFAENYALEHGIPTDLVVSDVLSVSVTDEDGNAITGDYTVKWYEKGSDEIIAVGKVFSGYDKDKEYLYEIILGEELSYIYYPPQMQTLIPGSGENKVSYKLSKIGTVTLSGTVEDENGNLLPYANISCEQTYNGKYKRIVNTNTNANGKFSVNIPNVSTSVKITAEGYYSKAKIAIDTKSDSNTVALGSTVMKKLPENKITMSIKRNGVRNPGTEPVITEITSVDNMSFSIRNETKDKEITDYEVQFPELIIADTSVEGGDVIEISVIDDNKKMTAETAHVTLDSQKNGDVEINFVENGYLSVTGITGNVSNYAMIFDGSGNFVKSYVAIASFTSDSLENGDYTLLLIKKTALLRGVTDLSKLNALGLAENTDYITKSFTVKAGEISTISNIAVPSFDESKLYYTVPESTKFASNATSATVGKYVVLRAEYEIDSKYSSGNETITIEIPEGVNFTNGSLTMDSKAVPHGVDGNTVTVMTNSRKGVIRFYVVATQKGNYDINAYLGFNNNGNDILQPIGTASFEATASKITLPEKTGRKSVPVTGIALSDSIVTLYDNDKVVGTTTSNKNGSWSLNIELDKPYSYSYHDIYATIKKDGYDLVTTDKELLIYDKDNIEVSKVTMISQNGDIEYVAELDYFNPKPVNAYSYSSGYPMFTFKVEFINGGDNETLSDVQIVANGINNEITRVPLTYDIVSECWLGAAEFSSDNAPVAIGVDFTLNTDEEKKFMVDADMIADLAAVKPEISESDMEILQSYFDVELIEENIDSDGNGTVVTRVNSDNGALNLTYSSQKVDEFTNDGSFEVTNLSDGNTSYFKREITDDYTIETMYDTNSKTLVSVKVESSPSLMGEEIQMFGFSQDLSALMQQLQYMTRWFSNSLNAASKNTDKLWQEYQQAKANNPCFYNSPNASYIENTAQREYSQIKEEINSSLGQFLSIVGSVSNLSFMLPSSAKNFIGSIIGKLATLGNLAALHGKMLNLAWMAERAANAGKPCGDPPGPMPEPNFPTPAIIDPSGYVYEAVPSNRIEGVKAECYYYDYPIDEFGVPGENKEEILWNAQEYDQVNPLYTDKDGRYAWDVPPGEWLVKFSKEGYYDADSRNDPAANGAGYLPVPPPQTEVNTAIVSKAAPTVKSVNVYNDEVQIIFSQYMQLDTVNTNNVKVMCGGREINGTISPDNAEYDYNQENQYASIFTFTPSEALSGNVTVEVRNARNYAGTMMVTKMPLTQKANVKPEGLSVNARVDVPYNSGALLEIEILPKEAGVNKTLTISTSSPSIVGVVNTKVTTDENGKANVMLSGNLPGEGEISISLDGTDINTKARATVGNVISNQNKCAKVTANIASGSTVEKGTEVILSTQTEGAEIYYTLDGTCPCVENNPARIKYTGPVVIDEYTFLIAYAVKPGMDDSSTAGFTYVVQASGNSVTPLTSTNYIKTQAGYDFNIECSEDISDKFLCIAIYNSDGKLIELKQPELDGTYKASFVTSEVATCAKVFVWDKTVLSPTAKEEIVNITN